MSSLAWGALQRLTVAERQEPHPRNGDAVQVDVRPIFCTKAVRPQAQGVDQLGAVADTIKRLRGGTVIATFFSTRKRFRVRAWAIAGSIALFMCGGRHALA